MEGSNQPDFKLQLHTVNSLNIDSVEKNMWNSNTKNQGPKSNLIDEEMPVHMLTNIKDKRARQQEPQESDTLMSARRLQPRAVQQSLGKKSIQEKNELNQKNDKLIREMTDKIIKETLT